MYQLLPLVVVLVSSLSQGSGEQCCKQKYVGEHLYNYVDSEPGVSQYGCHTDCVYSRFGESDSRYCFKPGDLIDLCLDNKCQEDSETRPKKHHCDRECREDSTPFTCEFNFTMRTQFTDADGRRADGRNRTVLTYNNVLPGPPLVICEGDKLVVNFKNEITGNLTTEDGSTNTTTLHFHGIREKFRPFSDGVPFVTQCPIQPKKEFPGGYGFDTDINGAPAGTYWYHSHVGAQRTNGAYGALIIKEKSSSNDLFDVDDAKNTLVLQEWYKSSIVQTPVSILINGNGRVGVEILEGSDDEIKKHLYGQGGEFYCVQNTEYSPYFTTNYTNFTIEDPGKSYRFRVIGAISQNVPLQLSIEDHNFTAIAMDSLNIEPVGNLTDLWLAAGERYDIVVYTKESYRPGEAYKIKIFGWANPSAQTGPLCSIAWLKYPGQTIDYDYVTPCNCAGFEPSSKDYRTLNPVPNKFNVWKGRLKYPDWKILTNTGGIFIGDLNASRQAPNIDATLNTQYIEFVGNITFNNLRMTYPNVPFLLQDPQQNTNRCGTTCEGHNLYTSSESSTCTEMRPANCPEPFGFCACEHVIQQPWASGNWVEIVLINNFNGTAAHPIHQHGGWYWVVGEHKFDPKNYTYGINRTYIMGQDRNCTAKKNCLPRNLVKPPAKDTIQVPPLGYVILRTPLDNAGTWIFHCHINFHVEKGMALVLQIGQAQDWCNGSLPWNEFCPTPPPSPTGGPSFIYWFYGMERNQVRCIEPGNDLVFSWTVKDHNVNHNITEEQYNTCNVNNPTPYRGDYIWTAPALPYGITSETHYFACGRFYDNTTKVGDHCEHGNMKLKVFVKNECP